MPTAPFSLTTPTYFWIALAMALAAGIAACVRRPAVPPATHALIALGLLLLSLAAGGLVWRRPAAREVAVLVDLSPSTRSADYRDPARLAARVRQLLGDTPYRMFYFADGLRDAAPPAGARLPDLPAERTTYDPPLGAAAVVLFSDGRFDPPPPTGGPPTYAVLDPGLIAPADAAVTALDLRAGSVAIQVRNDNAGGRARELDLTGVRGAWRVRLDAGSRVIARPAGAAAREVSAHLTPGDWWPENDALAGPLPPPVEGEQWLVGGAATVPPPPGWRAFAPADLPADPAAYLAPSVILLDNVPARALAPIQQDRLRQYVRDLGGGLVILGGDRAFAAGGYPGSALEALSPLASTPPRPTTRWMLVADASGSMGTPAAAGAASKWAFAVDAVVKVLPRLPADDLADVGSFAETFNWWSAGRTVRDTLAQPLPPAGARTGGPTNLRPVLDQVARQAEAGLPKQLLLLTDADADVGDAMTLATALSEKQIRLSLVALGDGRGLPALRQVAGATGGRVIRQDDAAKWAEAVDELVHQASAAFLESQPLTTRFTGGLSGLPAARATPWNRTWPKAGATPIAEGTTATNERVTPAATWQAGEGAVVAAGLTAGVAPLDRWAALVARRPHDPRYRVTWDAGERLRVSVDAVDNQTYLNGRRLDLELAPTGGAATTETHPIPQAGPGTYALALPAPRRPAFATLRADGRPIDRIAVAGRYAPEFDAIGVDRDALRALADRTGGGVIDLLDTQRIDFYWPSRDFQLAPWLAAGGALAVAAGLVWWRVR